MAHLRLHLPQLLNSFRPDLVLYNAGVDPHTDDPLGRLSLTDQGLFPLTYGETCTGISSCVYRNFVFCSFAIFRCFCFDLGLYDRDYYVINEAVSRGVACFTVIGGGYGKDIQILSKRHTLVHRAAAKVSVKLIAS